MGGETAAPSHVDIDNAERGCGPKVDDIINAPRAARAYTNVAMHRREKRREEERLSRVVTVEERFFEIGVGVLRCGWAAIEAG